jgi:hypothetical protein
MSPSSSVFYLAITYSKGHLSLDEIVYDDFFMLRALPKPSCLASLVG